MLLVFPKAFFIVYFIVDFILEACYNPCQEVIYNGISRYNPLRVTVTEEYKSMRKEYTINELTAIWGCSRTAIVKKIKTDENNPVIRRYKGLYDVVTSRGQMAILLDDKELEHEKKLSKGVSNVSSDTVTTSQSEDIIDIQPEKETVTNSNVLEFTNRYIEQFTTFQKEMYNEIRNRDNQINLLTTSEKTKENEYLRAQAENKQLRLRNTVLTVLLGVMITVLAVIITVHITTMQLSNVSEEKPQITQTENLQTPIPASTKKKNK